MIDRYVIDGAKKVLSLARTKIRLAREAETTECVPSPLPLVKHLSGRDVRTIDEADSYREMLRKEIDFFDERSIASTVLQCMDIIEGVKHLYEPKQYCFSLSDEQLLGIEEESIKGGRRVSILLMTESVVPNSINLYFGDNPPQGAVYASGVPTSLAPFLLFAFRSKHFSSSGRLRNISACLGRRTLINNAIFFSLGCYGIDLSSGAKYLDCDGVH